MADECEMDVQVHVAPELDPEEIYVPPMLIQPHLENAVWHGLRFKEGSKTLLIALTEYQSTYVKVIIEDNGVGRTRAGELQRQRISPTRHRSMGSRLSGEQLTLLQQQYSETRISVIDLTDDRGTVLGTRIELILPMMERPTLVD